MGKKITYVISDMFISLILDELITVNVHKNHRHFDLIKQKLRDDDTEGIEELIDDKIAIQNKFEDEGVSLEIHGNTILYNGEPLHNSIVDQIITTKEQGFKFDNLIKFLENLLHNTSKEIVNELYDWIEASKSISITEDGAFLAYKKVKDNYFDVWSGNIDNSIGEIVTMPREEVCADRNKTCAAGLHFCSHGYFDGYYGTGPSYRTVILKIFPQDVVSIPDEYKYQKGRCCKYEVVGEIDNKTGHILTKAVDDYENDEKVNIKNLSVTDMMEDYSLKHQMIMFNQFLTEKGKPNLVRFGSREYANKRLKRAFKEDFIAMMKIYKDYSKE